MVGSFEVQPLRDARERVWRIGRHLMSSNRESRGALAPLAGEGLGERLRKPLPFDCAAQFIVEHTQ